MRRRISYALILVLLLAGAALAAKNATNYPGNYERNIYQLFTKANPKLNAGTAKKYVDIVMAAGEKYKQDPYVIAAIIVHESTVNAQAISKGGDYGLMQVRWKVHQKAIKAEYPKVKSAKDFFDAKTNVFFGTRILSECAAKSKDTQGALLLYSGGGKKVTEKVLKTVKELQAMDKNTKKK